MTIITGHLIKAATLRISAIHLRGSLIMKKTQLSAGISTLTTGKVKRI